MTLAARIAQIEAMSRKERCKEWERVMRTVPPPAFGAGSLAFALAYHLQEKALGGLSRKDLQRIYLLGKVEDPELVGAQATSLRPGTWLSRTWHGEVHQVVILDSGVEYRAKRYASLSAVAQEITGAHWSGPRFFGLGSARLGALEVSGHGQ